MPLNQHMKFMYIKYMNYINKSCIRVWNWKFSGNQTSLLNPYKVQIMHNLYVIGI